MHPPPGSLVAEGVGVVDDGQRAAGIAVGAVGLGVLGWVLYPAIKRQLSGVKPQSISFAPNPPSTNAPFSVAMAASGQGGAQLAAQGVIVQQDGLVGGHLWSSAATAQAVNNEYWSTYDSTSGTPAQQAAAAEAAVAGISAQVSARVAVATAAGNGAVTLNLYSEGLIGGTYTIAVWVAPSTGKLLVADPVGTPFSTLQRSPVPYLAVQLVLP